MHGGVRILFMYFRFAWSTNLVHASWHLKVTMARTGVYRVNALARLWLAKATIFTGKRGIEPSSST